MDKYKKYFPSIIFVVLVLVLIYGIYSQIMPKMDEITNLRSTIEQQNSQLKQLKDKQDIVKKKLKQIKDSIINSPKKVYSPIESDLGNDTLFFTLYNDVIEMLHANSIKIHSINYQYNPEADDFVKFGKDVYFVCDINMDLISNYVNLGKLVQDLYQYPYYIKINRLEVNPYAKDKKVLLSKLSIRLYAHTAPEDIQPDQPETSAPNVPALDGANIPLPQ